MEWNKLDHDTRNSTSLRSFKSKCSKTWKRVNRNYYYGSRSLNVQLARMRIGCSNLRSDLCHNLHVEENPSCQCGFPEEDCAHYFFHCTLYTNQRRQLFRTIDPSTVNMSTILHGDNNKCIDENIRMFDAVYQYITDTRLFMLSET